MPSKATTAQKIRVYFTGLVPLPGEQLEKESWARLVDEDGASA